MRASFVDRIEHLRGAIRGWLAHDPGLALIDRSFVVEDVLGRYDVPGLEIVHDGGPIAMVQPLAADVIGAQGRLDVTGPLDNVAVVYLESAGRLETRNARDGDVVHLRPLFRGVEGPDWYWITGSRRVKYAGSMSRRSALF